MGTMESAPLAAIVQSLVVAINLSSQEVRKDVILHLLVSVLVVVNAWPIAYALNVAMVFAVQLKVPKFVQRIANVMTVFAAVQKTLTSVRMTASVVMAIMIQAKCAVRLALSVRLASHVEIVIVFLHSAAMVRQIGRASSVILRILKIAILTVLCRFAGMVRKGLMRSANL